jgi:type I restriction enzyme S subunit
VSAAPHGWAVTTVGAITRKVGSVDPAGTPDAPFTYVDIGSIDNSTHAIRSPKVVLGSEAPSRARQLLEAGDTVFSTVRTYLRNIGYVDTSLDHAVASTGFSVLRPAAGVVSKFLYYHSLTNDFVNGLTAVMRGTSYPAVVDSQVRGMPFALPPTAEQERIVAAIEEQFSRLDVGVAALVRAQQNLKRMRIVAFAGLADGVSDRDPPLTL